MNISADVSCAFEPMYMSYMANTIINNIDLDIEMKKKSSDSTKKRYVNKSRIVDVQGFKLQIRLSEDEYDKIF